MCTLRMGALVSASQGSDEAGTHFKEVHGVAALTRGQQGCAPGQRPRQRAAELGHLNSHARRVDAEPWSMEAGCRARALRSRRP